MFNWFQKRLLQRQKLALDVPWQTLAELALNDSSSCSHNTHDLHCPECQTPVVRYKMKQGYVVDITPWPDAGENRRSVWHDGDWVSTAESEDGEAITMSPELSWCRSCYCCGRAFAVVDVQFLDRTVDLYTFDRADYFGAQMAHIGNEVEEQRWWDSWLMFRASSDHKGQQVTVEGHIVGPFGIELGGYHPRPRKIDWRLAQLLVERLIGMRAARHKVRLPNVIELCSDEQVA